ncbi:SIMPL domain-containing protein [Mycobacterium sp. MYCO198283]|uniref:SIMPL domain-containing protein n=1 Tax=Mycobacterium sp. MYCO198283 TaxID=2883505 RepID=UPI001E2E47C0|nr:SIMPL domain-containing protein [Mycobacterium sp. MYCO198283]MCG5431462.1 SIMPL domain-containing protein [Mycobacterium sp. MYCO198283]
MVRVRRFLACLAVGSSAATLVACDAPGGSGSLTPSADNRQVTVVGEGTVSGTPDLLNASVAVEIAAPDARTAMDQASERQQRVITALTDAGVDRKDISTAQLSLQPQYGPAADATGSTTQSTGTPVPPAPNGQTIVAYRAVNGIDVTIRDIRDAPQVIAIVTNTGGDAIRINSVGYTFSDDSRLVQDARARAFNDAKARAEQYAKLSGLSLGRVISISESGGPPPVATKTPAPAMSEAVPLEPGQQTVSFAVTVIWQLD